LSGTYKPQQTLSGLPKESCHSSATLVSDVRKTRAAAAQWVRSIEFEMDQGLFVSRNKADTTTVAKLLERYLRERTVRKKGAGPESCRIRSLLRHPLAAV